MHPFKKWWRKFVGVNLPDQLPRKRCVAVEAWNAGVSAVIEKIRERADESKSIAHLHADHALNALASELQDLLSKDAQ